MKGVHVNTQKSFTLKKHCIDNSTCINDVVHDSSSPWKQYVDIKSYISPYNFKLIIFLVFSSFLM